MNSTHKWFILDLRIALAVYVGFIQFFSHPAQAQSADPGSLQTQMTQSRVERESQERRRGKKVADQNAAEKKVSQRQAILKLENGQQALGNEVIVENGKGNYHIFLGDKDFDLLVQKADGSKAQIPKNLSLKEMLAQMDGIKGTYSNSVQNIADDSEWKEMLADAEKYRAYKDEMQKFESSPIKSNLLQFAKGVEYENISKKNIMDERAALQAQKLSAVIREANVRFPKDTIMFFFAIGAVIAAELVAKHGGDPMAMQHHFDSLTDPIANLSFYTFILANGLSLHYLKLGASKKLIDMNHRLIFASLPMISMPFASLASNIVSDTAMTIKACSEQILTPKGATKKKKEEDQDQVYSACDEALRQWTLANKANQYLPQLLSLSLSNAPFIALGYATQAIGKKLQVYSFLGAETALVRVGGRIVMTGLKFLLSPIPAIALDMMITNPLTTRAWSTVSDGIRIDNARERILDNANRCAWQLQAKGSAPLTMPTSCKDLKEDAIILRDRSQSWRATINSDFETGFQSWTELMTKFNNQYNASQAFYSYVFNQILDFNYTKTLCEKYKVPNACVALENIFTQKNFVLTRKYPLVGAKVNPKVFNSSAEGDTPEEYAIKLKNAQSDFVLNPLFGIAQVANIQEQVGLFLTNSKALAAIHENIEKQILEVIVVKLQSNKLSVVSQGLTEFNELYRKILNTISGFSPFKQALISLKSGFGEIRSVQNQGEGFLWARSMHSSFDDARTPYEYQYHNIKYTSYTFPTTAHYFMHEMLCGETKSEWVYKIDFDKMFGSDDAIGKVGHAFTPPRLIKDSNKILGFCHSSAMEMDYSRTFNNKEAGIEDSGWKFNPTQYLLKAYNSELFDRIDESGRLYGTNEKDGTFKPKERNTYFGDWWTSANKETLDKFLSNARENWGRIYLELIMSFKNRGYVQDASQRTTIIKRAKGMMTDNVGKLLADKISEQSFGLVNIDYKTQPKNSLEVIQAESGIYFDLLKKFNITDNTKITMRKMDAIIDYMQAQNETIEYLQKIFDLGDAKTDVQLENAMKMPEADAISKHQESLGNALNQLKYFLVSAVTEPLVKSINTDIIYSLEGSTNDLNKYLMSANVIGLKDKEAIRLLKEQAKKMKQLMNLNSLNQGVRKNGR